MSSSKITGYENKLKKKIKPEQNMSFERRGMEIESAICYPPRAHLNPESKFLKISV